MGSSKAERIVPGQKVGSQTGATEEIELSNRAEATALFAKARQRLMNINHWHEYDPLFGARFWLMDSTGHPVDDVPQLGYLIRIDIPGPGPQSGHGYDWVEIEAIDDHSDPDAPEEHYGFRVRPAANPHTPEEEQAHFFSEEATSSFIVQRKNNALIASEIGRNELPNTAAGSVTDKVRNAIVGTAASAGFASIQWKSLMKGILSFPGN